MAFTVMRRVSFCFMKFTDQLVAVQQRSFCQYEMSRSLLFYSTVPPACPQDMMAMFPCVHCSAVFSNQAVLNGHISRVHLVKPFRCSECDTSYTNKKALKMHLNVHLQKFVCRICGRALAASDSLQRHERSHSDERSFQCSSCEMMFKNELLLRAHERTVHTTYSKVSCIRCGMVFVDMRRLSTHMKVHELPAEQQLSCKKCGGVFKHVPVLVKHEKQCSNIINNVH